VARSRLTQFFKKLDYKRVIDPNKLLKSKAGLEEVTRIAVPWHDKMVFTSIESDYLDKKYEKATESIGSFVESQKRIDTFWNEYERAAKDIKAAVKDVKQVHNYRARTLFPSGEKKSVAAYRRLNLDEKIARMSASEYYRTFDPSKFVRGVTLPPLPDVDSENLSKNQAVVVSLRRIWQVIEDPANNAPDVLTGFMQTVFTKAPRLYEAVAKLPHEDDKDGSSDDESQTV